MRIQLKKSHKAWLKAHPQRSEAWLKERLADGFHIHHMDGNHFNNVPNNLVLMEKQDHQMLHDRFPRKRARHTFYDVDHGWCSPDAT